MFQARGELLKTKATPRSGGTEASPISQERLEDLDRAAPNPAALIEAMRSLGYTLETAVADIVDNSLSHGATRVQVQFDWAGADSTLSISDNGSGMSEKRLVEAMRAGSHDPRADRAPSDLGRFGLGLKTASFSQATRLSVITRAEGFAEATRVWDLPHMVAVNDWLLLRNASAIATLQAKWMRSQPSGTCVVWENLDRLVGNAAVDNEVAHKVFMEAADRLARHLAMVFGEFLVGSNAIQIKVGNIALTRWDPFLRDHPATQVLPPEQLAWGLHGVSVQAYVLPHHTKLTKAEFEVASGSKVLSSTDL